MFSELWSTLYLVTLRLAANNNKISITQETMNVIYLPVIITPPKVSLL